MRHLTFLLLLFIAFFQACTGQHGEAGPVQMDQGKRWQANPETTSGIAEMQAILNNYEGKTADVSGRKALQSELETAFQVIFEKCTMTGPAHDQLHNYLLPMKDMLKKIGSGTSGESDQAIDQLKKHLANYPTYFQ